MLSRCPRRCSRAWWKNSRPEKIRTNAFLAAEKTRVAPGAQRRAGLPCASQPASRDVGRCGVRCGAKKVAVSAIGVAVNVVPFERRAAYQYDRTDPLSDHVEELTDLFTDWVTTTWRTCTRRPKRTSPNSSTPPTSVHDTSGVVELVENWRIEDGLQTGRGGRPQYVTIRTAIVLWVHMALTKRPQLVARMSEVVAFGMKPYMRDYFSLVNENVDPSTRDGRMDYNNDWYHRIWRALERVRATIWSRTRACLGTLRTRLTSGLSSWTYSGSTRRRRPKKNYEPTEEELLAEKRMARCDGVLQPPAVGHRRSSATNLGSGTATLPWTARRLRSPPTAQPEQAGHVSGQGSRAP